MWRLVTLVALALIAGCHDKPRAEQAPPKSVEPDRTQQAFDDIYRSGAWGRNDAGAGHSGTGSTLEATVEYRSLLQKFLAEHRIKTVVDAGCGDWEFSSSIDWTGIDYKGFDIVPAVIEHDRARYARPGVQFAVANIVEDDLPAADLLICKHVLQHLPDKDVAAFLNKLPKYKFALITNGVDSTTLSATHATDIAPGGYRHLDITKPPFNIPGIKLATYRDAYDTHQVILVRRDASQ